MATAQEQGPAQGPPSWAIERASAELGATAGRTLIIDRAWEIVRASAAQDDERHDEYDDPDQGGEG